MLVNSVTANEESALVPRFPNRPALTAFIRPRRALLNRNKGSAIEEARRYPVRRAPPWGLEACALHPFVTNNDQSQRRVLWTEPSSRRMMIVRHPRSFDRSL
jgi:hypothetical protein